MLNNDEKPSVGAGVMVSVETGSGYMATERVLISEDAVSSFSIVRIAWILPE